LIPAHATIFHIASGVNAGVNADVRFGYRTPIVHEAVWSMSAGRATLRNRVERIKGQIEGIEDHIRHHVAGVDIATLGPCELGLRACAADAIKAHVVARGAPGSSCRRHAVTWSRRMARAPAAAFARSRGDGDAASC